MPSIQWVNKHNGQLAFQQMRFQQWAAMVAAAQAGRPNPEPVPPRQGWFDQNRKEILTRETRLAGFKPGPDGLPIITSSEIEKALKPQLEQIKKASKEHKEAYEKLEKFNEQDEQVIAPPAVTSAKITFSEEIKYKVRKTNEKGEDIGVWPEVSSLEDVPKFYYTEIKPKKTVGFAETLKEPPPGVTRRTSSRENPNTSEEEKAEATKKYRAQPAEISRAEFEDTMRVFEIEDREQKSVEQKGNPRKEKRKMVAVSWKQKGVVGDQIKIKTATAALNEDTPFSDFGEKWKANDATLINSLQLEEEEGSAIAQKRGELTSEKRNAANAEDTAQRSYTERAKSLKDRLNALVAVVESRFEAQFGDGILDGIKQSASEHLGAPGAGTIEGTTAETLIEKYDVFDPPPSPNLSGGT